MRIFSQQLVGIVLSALLVVPLRAAERNRINLGDLSIEELMNESVTSVSKKATRLSESPAAIAIVSPEDIERLGITSLPEALRLVPGVNVARINANKWAVSARGFNTQFANNLLVLIDGRSVYTPAFAGVYWDAQDVMLQDLDRIEVIRGPGATLWGANAVNGVINIATKSARDTQGTLISTAAGTEERSSVSARHGGQLGPNLYYRAYVKYFDRSAFVDPTGRAAPDEWDMLRGGFRLDRESPLAGTFTLQGDLYRGETGEAKQRASLTPPYSQNFIARGKDTGGNLVGRWTRTFSARSELTVQAYYDYFEQNAGPELNTEKRDTVDFDLLHRFGWGEHHDVIWGAGYRSTSDDLPGNFGLTWTPRHRRDQLFSAFVQDEIGFAQNRLRLTVGSKFEHNDYTGVEVQPNVRLLWVPNSRQTLWGSISRAVRTPSRFDHSARLNVAAFPASPASPPFLVSLFANPETKSEKLMAYELGYRVEPSRTLSIDAAGFFHAYDDLMEFQPGPSRLETTPSPTHVLLNPSTLQNSQAAETHGAEITAQWRATHRWKLVAGYTWLQMRVHPDPADEGSSPQHQFHLRSFYDLPRGFQLNAATYSVSRLSADRIPAYVRLDVGVSWRPTRSLELGVWGHNLLDRHHPEISSTSSKIQTEVPRSFLGKITWSF